MYEASYYADAKRGERICNYRLGIWGFSSLGRAEVAQEVARPGDDIPLYDMAHAGVKHIVRFAWSLEAKRNPQKAEEKRDRI